MVAGRLQGMRVLSRSPSGRAVSVEVQGSRGDRVASAASIRTELGLRSTWLTDISGP
jgi:peptidoglycan hydrolase-like amidase